LLYSGNGQNAYSFRPGYFLNPLHSIPLFLSGSYALMLLTTFIPDNVKILEYIGKNSMGFLVIHPTLQMVYLFTIGEYIKSCSTVVQILIFFVAYIAFLSLCKPINEFLLKFAPWSLGKK
jgi:fucose 4-O-acetylase-like acetyltransferase